MTPDKLNLAPAQSIVATNESTTSDSFTTLTTAGPVVTVTIGSNGLALVSIYGKLAQAANGGTAVMGFSVSGVGGVGTGFFADRRIAVIPL